MAKAKHSELVAGTFVVLALGAGVGVLIWLGAANVFGSKGQVVCFAAPLEQGSLGVQVGSAVKIGDVLEGTVGEIRVDLKRMQTLYLTVFDKAATRVYSNARAQAVSEFIGGASIVVQDPGDPKSPPPDADHPILIGQGANAMVKQAQDTLGYGDKQRQQFQDTLAYVSAAAADVKTITGAIVAETSTRPGSLLNEVKRVADNLDSTSANLAAMSKNLLGETDRAAPGSLLAKVRQAADDIEKTTGAVAGLVQKVAPQVEDTVALVNSYAKKDVADLLAEMRKISTGLVGIIGDFKSASETARDVIVLNRHGLDDMIADLTSTAQNLNAAAKEIRRNPWRLLQQPGDKDVRTQNIYDAVRAFGEGAERLNDAVARLEALRKLEKVKADDPEVIRVRQHLEETFKKFRTVENALWDELAK